MGQNQKVFIGILIILIIVIGLVVTYKIIKKSEKNNSTVANYIETENNTKNDNEITWEEITEDGVDEELLFENINSVLVTQITAELQTLVEETKEEIENPEALTTEELKKISEHERYKKVLNMGNSAIKPLYLILYASLEEGEYEYICSKILYELSGFEFNWTNSKDFLDGFNQEVLDRKAM